MTWFVNVYMGSSGNRVPHSIHYWSIIIIHYPHKHLHKWEANLPFADTPKYHMVGWLDPIWSLYSPIISPPNPHNMIVLHGVQSHITSQMAISRMCDALDRVLRSDPCSSLPGRSGAKNFVQPTLQTTPQPEKNEKGGAHEQRQILLPFLSLHFPPPKKQTMQRFSQMLLWGASFVLDRNHCRTWKLQTSQLHGGMNEAVRSCAAATMLTTQSKHLKHHEWMSKSPGSHRTLI